jgi:twitching motility protein PilT
MSLVPSLLQAIVGVDGEALVMHAGDKPYVVAPSGQIELASRGLTLDAVNGIVSQLLPADALRSLEEFGAIQQDLATQAEFPGESFTVVAARGGDDVWVEIRRRKIPDDDLVPDEFFAPAPAPDSDLSAVASDAPAPAIPQAEPPRAPQFTATSQSGIDKTGLSGHAARQEEMLQRDLDEQDEVRIDLDSLDVPDAAVLFAPSEATAPAGSGGSGTSETPEPQPDRELIRPQAVSESAPWVTAASASAPSVTPVPPPPTAASAPVAPVAVPPPAASAEVELEPTAPTPTAPTAVAKPPAPPPVVPVVVAAAPVAQAPVAPAPVAASSAVAPPPVAPAMVSQPPVPPVVPVPVVPQPVAAEQVPPAIASAPTRPPVTPIPVMPPPVATPPAPSVASAPMSTPQSAPPAAEHREVARPVFETPVLVPPPVHTPQPEPDFRASSPQAVVLPISRSPIRSDTPPPVIPVGVSGLDRLLRMAAARGASTLYLSSDARPSVRVDGEIQMLDGEPSHGPNDVESLLLTLMPDRNHEALRSGVATEWISDVDGVGRVRCLSFRDHRGPGGVFRMMPVRAVSSEQLGLSSEVQALALEPGGLVLVAGSRLSGKRTMISALVDLINHTRRDHVITIESEINVVHERGTSFISQREVRGGYDEVEGVTRAVLREDPDVLVVESLRTAPLINVALEAAASGRLVIGGFPAHNTTAAVDRIINLYPPENRRQVQLALAENLRGIVAQVLLRKPGGGRLAAREVLLNTPAVASIIAEGRTSQLPLAIEGGRRQGMMPLNDALVGFVQSGAVDVREAFRRAADRAGFLALLKRMGMDTTAIERMAPPDANAVRNAEGRT